MNPHEEKRDTFGSLLNTMQEEIEPFRPIETNKQFRILLDGLGDAIHVVDRHLRIIFFNKKFHDWNRELGLPLSVIGKDIKSIFPFLPDQVLREYDRVFQTGEPFVSVECTKIRQKHIYTETRKIPISHHDKVDQVITIIRDVTHQKEALEQSAFEEKRFQLLFNHTNDAIFVHGIDEKGMPGPFMMVNDTACKRFGYSRDEFLKLKPGEIDEPKSAIRVPEIMKRLEEENHVVFDMDQVTRDGRVIPSELSSHFFEMDGKGTILTISRDITGRKQVEEALKETEERYKALFNRSLHAVYIHDFKGNFIDANHAALDLLGYISEDIPNLNFGNLLEKKDIPRALRITREIRKFGRQEQIAHYRLKCKDGSKIHVETEGVCLYRNGDPIAVQGIARDITDQKRTEERLRRSEEKYRSLVENLHDGFAAVDMEGRITDYNPAFLSMLGYEAEEIENLTFENITHEKWHKDEAKILKKQVMKRGYSDLYQKEYIRKDGTVFPVELRTYLYHDIKKRPVGMWAFVRDISDRKRIEETIRESEEKFRNLAEQSPNMIFIHTMKRVVYANRKCEELLGYDREAYYSGKFNFMNLHAPEYHEKLKDSYRKHREGLNVPPYESVILTRSGARRSVILTTKLIKYQGQDAIMGIITDVTDLKRVEAALEEEHAFRAVAIKQASEGMCVCYTKGIPPKFVFTEWNDRMKEITGYSMEEINTLGIPKTLLKEESLWQRGFEFAKRIQAGEDIGSNEWKITRADGAKRLVTATASTLRVADGKTRLLATINDITDQRRALEALKESEEKYSNLFQHSNDAIFLHDLKGSIIDVNRTALDLFGYTTAELLRMHVQDLHPEESAEDSKAAFRKIIQDGYIQFEVLFRKKCGEVFPAEVSSSLYEIRGKQIIQGMVRDITDRKLAEEALRVSEERYRTITENVNAGLYRNTPGLKGKFIEANPSLIKMFGYDSKEEFLKIHVSDLYMHPEDRKNFNEKMQRDGHVKNEELLLKRKDGSTFWGSVTAVAVFDADGDLNYFDGVVEDISEKRESEDRMRMNLKEKEVLLKEIHHRVKNNMQVVNSLLGLQSRYIEDEAALRMFRESQDRVRSMALIHEKLYGSRDLARIDFGEYIRTLANTLYRTYSADPACIRLTVDVGKVFLSIEQAVPCGLIVNELVSNALKHGFPRMQKERGAIRVSMQKNEGEEIEMIVEDDGVGLPEGFDLRKTDSLGMRLITILVEDQLDGSVEFASDEYTRFCIRFQSIDEKQEDTVSDRKT